MKIVAIANQKGGVGKTTTAVNLSACLAAAEKRTLLVDFDPQANAGTGLGIRSDAVQYNVYHALSGEKRFSEVACKTSLDHLQVVPAGLDLTGAEIELVTVEQRETVLRRAMEEISGKYDFVIIDCPPSLGLLTLNVLCAANSILIPIQAEYYAMEGLSNLLRTIEIIRQSLNPTLAIEGILLTMVDSRTNLSNQVADEIRKYFKSVVYTCVIPRNVRIAEAPSHGKPVILHDIASKGSQSYLALAEEFLKRQENGK